MNIKDYEFSDDDVLLHNDLDCCLVFYNCSDKGLFRINPDDVIAMAKHFKLTIDDIEGK